MSDSLPSSVVDALRWLQGQAQLVNGTTPADSPDRRASECLAELLFRLHGQGVSFPELAKACGVTHAAIQMRIRRHGYAEQYPSMRGAQYGQRAGSPPPPKTPRPPRSDCGVCGRALAGDNLGVRGDGRRYCRHCNSRYGRERYAQQHA